MNRFLSFFLFAVLSIMLVTSTYAQPRQQVSMDLNWQFAQADYPEAKNPVFDDSGWRTLDVPHDWSVEGEYDQDNPGGGRIAYLPTGIGWYRKTFTVPEQMVDKKVWIQFDGIYMNSDVWINGQHLGHRPYGYITFAYDLSDYLQEGENVISVRVDNSKEPSTRWYNGSGIYRHTWLTVTDPLHVAHWGVFARTPVASEDSAVVAIETTLKNDRSGPQQGELVSVLVDPDGNEVARGTRSFSLEAGAEDTVNQRLRVDDPRLWSIDSPSLYELRSIVQTGGEPVDEKITTIGIRDIEYKTNKGFFLNGEHVKMNGVNLHHGGGPVGAAVPDGIWERRFKKLKEMGVNAIRTAHNPMSPAFMDLCDRMGFLVMDEVFDEWRIPKGNAEYTYHIYFDEWAERDVRDFIKRDRNHPSVVLWSAGNEIPDQSAETGVGTLEFLQGIFHQLDPTRPVTTGNDNIGRRDAPNDPGEPTTLEFLNAVDIVGYNYADRWTIRRELVYTPDKLAHPEWKMIGTESGNIAGERGGYSLGNDEDRPRPSYNDDAIRAQELWKFVSTHDYVIGDFMWTGVDYLGESGWPGKHSYSGTLDLAGFEKDGFYFYQSQWFEPEEKPVLHLFPHWNWPEEREEQFIPVLAYTNMDTVDLYLNDRFIGQRRVEFPRQGMSCGWLCYDEPRVNPTTVDLFASWDVPYEPGKLRAEGRANGKVVATKEVTTAGPPAALRVSLDTGTLTANGRDVAHLVIDVVDENGNLVPRADNRLEFDIRGAGKIIGLENGNRNDHTSYSIRDHRNAFNGKALAIIQSTRQAGSITVEVSTEGLGSESVQLNTTADEGPAYYYEEKF